MGYPMRWEQIAAPEVPEIAISQETLVPPSLRAYFWRMSLCTLLGAAMLVVTVIGGFSLFLNGRSPSALELERGPQGSEAALIKPAAIRRVGYVSVTGSILNRTNNPLDHVEAVVELFDTMRHTVRAESAMVARETIAPGQTSPFQVAMADDTRAVGYRVHFKKLYGPSLD